jgi:uncharacterized membrane protein
MRMSIKVMRRAAARVRTPAGDRVSGGARLALAAVLVPAVCLSVVVMLLLWPVGPVGDGGAAGGVRGDAVAGAQVLSVSARACSAEDLGTAPVTPGAADGSCVDALVRLTSGPDAGREATVVVPLEVYRAGLEPGAAVRVGAFDDAYVWVDVDRSAPLAALAAVFALLVVAVGRFRGLAALAGLVLAYLTVLEFVLPSLLLGGNPAAVALSAAVVIMTVVLYAAHGFSAKTSVALLGTVVGLVVSTALAGWATRSLHLTGLSSEESLSVSGLTGAPDLSGIVLCGIVVAGLGVLNDVTVTQASAVWEVRASAPALGRRALFASGMRVGRDHLNSTVYTIAFAYAGAALPTLLLVTVSGVPFGDLLRSVEVAEEVARTCVGAIGLVLAVPVTTAVAAAVAATTRPPVAQAPATSTTGGPDPAGTAGAPAQ